MKSPSISNGYFIVIRTGGNEYLLTTFLHSIELSAEGMRLTPVLVSKRASAECMLLTDLPDVTPIKWIDFYITARLMLALGNDRGRAMLTVIMLSLCLSSVDVGTIT